MIIEEEEKISFFLTLVRSLARLFLSFLFSQNKRVKQTEQKEKKFTYEELQEVEK